MKKHFLTSLATGAMVSVFTLGIGSVSAMAKGEAPKLSEKEFETAKNLYFERCAGCHGVLRKGATGKSLEPKHTLKLGTEKLARVITEGTDGGMNPFNDIFNKEQITLLAKYIQHTPAVPPEFSLAQMQKATTVLVDPKDYPKKPLHGRNWKNFLHCHRA